MAKKQKIKKKKTIGDFILTLILIIAIGVFSFAAFKLVNIYLEYKKGTDEYNALEKMAVTDRDPDLIQQEEEETETLQPPIKVDFEPLLMNPDVIGWLYVEAIPDISYPVVQGKDNNQYLHTTYMGTYNFAGTIFIDCDNKSDFSDCNTIVYGHNMLNGSMFGKLPKFSDRETYLTSKYIWMLTPTVNYRYEIFSAYVTGPKSSTYTLFMGPGEEFLEYAEEMKRNSTVEMDPVEIGITDKILTLSTCTNDSANRFVVQAKMIDAVPVN